MCLYFGFFNNNFTIERNWEMEIFRPDLILVCGDKIYKGQSINRILGVEDLSKAIELDKKTVADILFLESVSGFLNLSNRGSMQILRDNLNHVKDFNSNGSPFLYRIYA